jgi:hypothetical protein
MTWNRGVMLAGALVWLVSTLMVAAWASAALALDGSTLRWTSAGLGLAASTLVPVVGGLFVVRTLRARGRTVLAGRTVAGVMVALDAVLLVAVFLLHPNPVGAAKVGASRWFWQDLELTAVAPVEPGVTSDAVSGARAAAHAVLDDGEANAVANALTDASAAAVGAVWMQFLVETWGDELRLRAGDAAWADVHRGLPAGDGVWGDPIAIESALTADGRNFLARVAILANAVSASDQPVRLASPFLPESVLRRVVPGGARIADDAVAREVAMNRVEVDLPGATFDVRHEAGAWRLHLGDYRDLVQRDVPARALLIALGP